MGKERKDKLDNQTNDLYRAYGHFIVEFEQMCQSIRFCIIFIMDINGLKEQEFTQVLLADLTAAPLITKLRALISIIYKNDLAQIKHTEPLFKFCISINEQRNEIVHGTWSIGWASQEQKEFDIALGRKAKATKRGLEVKSYSYTAKIFDELTEQLKVSTKLIFGLLNCILNDYLPSKILENDNLSKLK